MLHKPVIKLTKVGERWHMKHLVPDKIVKCRSKDELKRLLDWYSYPFIAHRVPDNVAARRRYVEEVRPALRWFCKKYGEKVPTWLEGNGHYDELPPEEREKLFGAEPFKVREFEEYSQSEGPDADAQ